MSAMDDFFESLTSYRERRRDELMRRRIHHETCLKEIDGMLADLTKMDEKSADLMDFFSEQEEDEENQ